MIVVLAALAAASPPTIDVGAKTTVALYLVTPTGAASDIPSASIIGAAERALAADPSVELWPMERAGVAPDLLDRCPIETRLSCWVAAMRSSKAAYLWALALQPLGDGRDRVRTIFIDLEGGADPSRSEEELFSMAGRDKGHHVAGAEALESYFVGVVRTIVRPALDAAGRWRPYGRISVRAPVDDLTVLVDGRVAGVLRAGTTVLDGVEPGRRRVEARSGDHSQVHDVVVRRSDTATLELVSPPVAWHPLRTGAVYGGGVVAAGGIAILVWSLVRASDGVRGGCLQRGGMSGSCDGIGALTFGYEPSRAPTSDLSAVDPSGVVMAPLGAGLIATGAAWSAGAFYGDVDTAPWWSIAVGVAAGIVVYGVGHALE